jgi:hypothetical protein
MKEIKLLLESVNKLRIAQKHKVMLFYMGMAYLLIQATTALVVVNKLGGLVERFVRVAIP